MRNSSTVGFSIEAADKERLEELAQRFGGGNRSAFLRSAMDHMERLARAEDLAETQAYGSRQLSERGLTVRDVPRLVAEVMSAEDPQVAARVAPIVSDVISRYGVLTEPYERTEGDPTLSATLRAALATTPEQQVSGCTDYADLVEHVGDGYSMLVLEGPNVSAVRELLRRALPTHASEPETLNA